MVSTKKKNKFIKVEKIYKIAFKNTESDTREIVKLMPKICIIIPNIHYKLT